MAVLALIPLFVVTGAWTALLAVVASGGRRAATCASISDLMQRRARSLALLVIGIGAPLSEELLFRGFLFSGLAKSRLGLVGSRSPDLGRCGRRCIHGYSVFGLIEVFAHRPLSLVASGAHRQPVGADRSAMPSTIR